MENAAIDGTKFKTRLDVRDCEIIVDKVIPVLRTGFEENFSQFRQGWI